MGGSSDDSMKRVIEGKDLMLGAGGHGVEHANSLEHAEYLAQVNPELAAQISKFDSVCEMSTNQERRFILLGSSNPTGTQAEGLVDHADYDCIEIPKPVLTKRKKRRARKPWEPLEEPFCRRSPRIAAMRGGKHSGAETNAATNPESLAIVPVATEEPLE